MEQVRSFAVPVLDFSRADEDLAADWDRAFSTVGFAAVVNHGLSAREVTEWARSYFSRSREDKLRDFQGRYGAGGYTPQGVEAVAQSFATDSAEKKSDALPDEVESFVFQTPDCRGNAVPAQYYADALQLTRRLMRISGIALNYDFLKHFERPECHLRLAQYPAVVKSGAPLRYGQHTDFTGLTLLFANPLKGFQLQLPSTGEWVEIELPGIVDHSDVLLVNSGDLIKRWTSDRWHSTVHRVSAVPLPNDRVSVVFFTGPSNDTLIESFGQNSTKYPPILCGDHLHEKLNAINKK